MNVFILDLVKNPAGKHQQRVHTQVHQTPVAGFTPVRGRRSAFAVPRRLPAPSSGGRTVHDNRLGQIWSRCALEELRPVDMTYMAVYGHPGSLLVLVECSVVRLFCVRRSIETNKHRRESTHDPPRVGVFLFNDPNWVTGSPLKDGSGFQKVVCFDEASQWSLVPKAVDHWFSFVDHWFQKDL